MPQSRFGETRPSWLYRHESKVNDCHKLENKHKVKSTEQQNIQFNVPIDQDGERQASSTIRDYLPARHFPNKLKFITDVRSGQRVEKSEKAKRKTVGKREKGRKMKRCES